MKTYILIKRTLGTTTITRDEWRRINNDMKDEVTKPVGARCEDIKLFNEGGDYNYLGDNDVVLEVKQTTGNDDFWTLDVRKKTTNYKELVERSKDSSLKAGWLSPDGRMHYCQYNDHISYVHNVLDTTVPMIEAQGWLHIIKGSDGNPFYSSVGKTRMTMAQAKKLKLMGVHVFDDDVMYH